MSLMKKSFAELMGTFWLVFGGCGSAIIAGKSIGLLGISLAFGLTVLTMAYAIGPISGCHLNPAVSVGLWVSGRFSFKNLIPYIISQVLGAALAAGLLYLLMIGQPGFHLGQGFASNGYGIHSPGEFPWLSCFVMECVLTFVFLIIILGATDKRSSAGFAPIAIGLGLTLIHLVGIPVTNLSVNPARSTGPAIFVGGEAISQLWLFWAAPVLGAILAGLVYRWVFEEKK